MNLKLAFLATWQLSFAEKKVQDYYCALDIMRLILLVIRESAKWALHSSLRRALLNLCLVVLFVYLKVRAQVTISFYTVFTHSELDTFTNLTEFVLNYIVFYF